MGNLASRATAMVDRYFDGVLPEPGDDSAAEVHVQESLARSADIADESMVAMDFSTGIAAVKEFIDVVNLYVTEQEPWKVAKGEDEVSQRRLATILYTVCESLRAIAVLHHSLMPKATTILWEQIGAAEQLGELTGQRVQDAGAWGVIRPGARVTKGAVLFPRLEEAPAQ
jgi:methionyl-tRNA synthetase